MSRMSRIRSCIINRTLKEDFRNLCVAFPKHSEQVPKSKAQTRLEGHCFDQPHRSHFARDFLHVVAELPLFLSSEACDRPDA